MDELSSKSSFAYEDLLQCAHGELFGPGNARLPLPPMLMFDRIVSISDEGGEHGNGEIIAESGSHLVIDEGAGPAVWGSTPGGRCSGFSSVG